MGSRYVSCWYRRLAGSERRLETGIQQHDGIVLVAWSFFLFANHAAFIRNPAGQKHSSGTKGRRSRCGKEKTEYYLQVLRGGKSAGEQFLCQVPKIVVRRRQGGRDQGMSILRTTERYKRCALFKLQAGSIELLLFGCFSASNILGI
jgi:hypothetical protein